MPTFIFTGRNAKGQLITGRRLAQSTDTLSSQLIKEGVTPVEISADERQSKIREILRNFILGRSISAEELSIFARQMHTLTKTGVPITSALRQLADNARTVNMSNALYGIIENLEGGQDLATAMQEYPMIFNPIMINMVRVGQASGKLDEAFLRLNQYLELEVSALKRTKTIIRYPLFILITVIAAIFFINILVIPTFSRVFEQANIQLPKITAFLIGFSKFFTQYWFYTLSFLGALVIAIYYYLTSPQGKLTWHEYQLRIPVIGTILRRILLLRFAQSFSIVISSGISLVEGIDLVAQAINNEYARQEVLSIRDAVQRGHSLTQAAAATHLFTSLELQMLAVSEETGELAQMFEQVALYYRREVDYDLKRLNDFLEPALIVGLALIVLGIALAVYLPIWNMVNLVHH